MSSLLWRLCLCRQLLIELPDGHLLHLLLPRIHIHPAHSTADSRLLLRCIRRWRAVQNLVDGVFVFAEVADTGGLTEFLGGGVVLELLLLVAVLVV